MTTPTSDVRDCLSKHLTESEALAISLLQRKALEQRRLRRRLGVALAGLLVVMIGSLGAGRDLQNPDFVLLTLFTCTTLIVCQIAHLNLTTTQQAVSDRISRSRRPE